MDKNVFGLPVCWQNIWSTPINHKQFASLGNLITDYHRMISEYHLLIQHSCVCIRALTTDNHWIISEYQRLIQHNCVCVCALQIFVKTASCYTNDNDNAQWCKVLYTSYYPAQPQIEHNIHAEPQNTAVHNVHHLQSLSNITVLLIAGPDNRHAPLLGIIAEITHLNQHVCLNVLISNKYKWHILVLHQWIDRDWCL